jgi:hypothetical protein
MKNYMRFCSHFESCYLTKYLPKKYICMYTLERIWTESECEEVEGMELIQDTVQWRAFVNTLMNIS